MTVQGIETLDPFATEPAEPVVGAAQPGVGAPSPVASPTPLTPADSVGVLKPIDLPQIVFDKPQFESFLKMLEGTQEGVPADRKIPAVDLFAQQLAMEAEASNPGLITFEGLRDGTAPIFDMLENQRDLSPNLRRLSSDDIIELFAVDPNGKPIQRGTFLEGFKRDAVTQTGALAGAAVGWNMGMAAQQAIAPSNPVSVGAKIALPVLGTIGGLMGFMFGQEMGGDAQEAIFSPEVPILPSYRAEYEAGKTAAGALAWLPLPFMMGSNYLKAEMGASAYLKNIAANRLAATRVGPMTAAEKASYQALTPTQQAQAAMKKDPMLQRLLAGSEKALARTGAEARKAPGATVLVETLLGAGATAGAALSEGMAPGDWRARMAGEMGGSVAAVAFTNPVAAVATRLGSITEVFKSQKDTFTQGGMEAVMSPIQNARKKKAVNKIYTLLEQNKEDIPALIKALSDNKSFIDPVTQEKIQITSGLKTGSPTLLGIENALDQLGNSLGENRTQAANQMLDALEVMVFSLINTDDQKALQEAGSIMNSIFESNLETKLTSATDNVLSAFTRVRGDTAEGAMDLSRSLSTVIDSSLTQARTKEKKLYDAVTNNSLSLDSPRFMQVWDEKLPQTKEAREDVTSQLKALKDFMKRVSEPVDTAVDNGLDAGDAPSEEIVQQFPGKDIPLETSVTELIDMRSNALAMGRKLRATGDAPAAGVAFAMADALLDDIDGAVGKDSAYTVARSYSKALNDVFTRAFVGKTSLKDKTGADRVSPELIMDKLFQGGSNPTYLRLADIHEVGTFLVEQNLADAEETVGSLADITDKMVRNAAASIFDTETGQVSPKKLADWRERNALILEKIPGLSDDLADAASAANTVSLVTNENSVINKKVKNEINFKNLLVDTNESPTQVIASIMSKGHKTPLKSLNRLFDVVNNAPEDIKESAMKGLQQSILEWGFTYGGGTSRTMSPSATYSALFEKVPAAMSADTTPMRWMLEKGLITKSEENNLKKTLTEMIKYEAGEASGEIGPLIDKAGPLLDMYLRISGSNLGAKVSQLTGGSGSGLIAGSAGSRLMRDVFAKLPSSMKTDVMAEIMSNPQLLAAMLREGRTESEKLAIAQRVTDMLSELGFAVPRRLIPAVGRETRPEEEGQISPDIAVVPGAKEDFRLQQQRRAAQQAAGLNAQSQPRVQAPRPVAPPPQAPQQMAPPPQAAPPPISSSGPVDRERYAALFPEDRDLLGIGSLMGNA
jgi:hypothetical protein